MARPDDTSRDVADADRAPRQGERIGRFNILEKLGEGGFGVVVRALDTDLRREVALKFPRVRPGSDPELWTRFLTEARAAARLEHGNICSVYQVVTQGERPFIVMGFVRGVSLNQILRRQPRPSPMQIARWMRTVVTALAYAHKNGIIHRDLKPDNIMIREDGEPVVMDFGLARIAESQTQLTMTGQVMGTPAYMSPEQAEGRAGDIGPPTDIYSIGAVLYRLLCGRVPFKGAVFEVIGRISRGDFPRPSEVADGVDPQLEAVCLKAMALRIEDRYGSMYQLRDEFDAWIAGHPLAGSYESDSSHRQKPTRPAAGTMQMAGAAPQPTFAGIEDTEPLHKRLQRKGARRKRPAWLVAVLAAASLLLLTIILAVVLSRPRTGPQKNNDTDSRVEKELQKLREAIKELMRQGNQPAPAPAKKVPIPPDNKVDLKAVPLMGQAKVLRDNVLSMRRKGDKDGEFNALLSLSNQLLAEGDYRTAHAVAGQMVALAGTNATDAAFAVEQQGLVLAQAGDYVGALARYELSQKSLRKVYRAAMTLPDTPSNRRLHSGVARLLGLNLNRIGNANKHLERYKAAETAYLESLQVLKPYDDRKHEQQLVYSNYGSLLSNRGEHAKALSAIRKSVDLCRELKDLDAEAAALINLGNAQTRSGSLKAALASYEAASRALGDHPKYGAHATLLYNWVLALAEDRQWKAARTQLQTLKRIARPEDRRSQKLIDRLWPLLPRK